MKKLVLRIKDMAFMQFKTKEGLVPKYIYFGKMLTLDWMSDKKLKCQSHGKGNL